MWHETFGNIIVWDQVKEKIHPEDIEEALRRHAAGEWYSPVEWINNLYRGLFHHYTWSDHRDRNGVPFIVTFDLETREVNVAPNSRAGGW